MLFETACGLKARIKHCVGQKCFKKLSFYSHVFGPPCIYLWVDAPARYMPANLAP